MYNLAKLLTEEPEKLERIGILFLKLLVTLLIVSTFFGFNISISGFVENPIPKDYTIAKLILFLTLLIITWIIVWIFIAELILSSSLIWLLSKFGNKKNFFYYILDILNVVEKEKKNLSPAKNIITFNSFIQNFSEDDEKNINAEKSRIRQYYIVTVVIYIALLYSKDTLLPCWLKWGGAIMILNFLIGSIILNKVHNYFTENLDEMKKQFSHMAYTQMIINAIETNKFIKIHYEKNKSWRRIYLNKKSEIELLPKALKIYPVFNWNDELLQETLYKEMQKRSEKSFPTDKTGKYYDVIISNVKPNNENVRNILSQQGFAYLYCENEEQIYKNLEIFLFKITNGMYRND